MTAMADETDIGALRKLLQKARHDCLAALPAVLSELEQLRTELEQARAERDEMAAALERAGNDLYLAAAALLQIDTKKADAVAACGEAAALKVNRT